MELSPTKQALLEKWLKGQSIVELTSIKPRPQDSQLPLSFPQQRQLFLELLEGGTSVNNLPVFLDIVGNINHVALEQSVNQILARHDVLRTRFLFGQGLPIPETLGELKITIPVVDVQNLNGTTQLIEARRLAEREASIAFDLSKAPLLRLRLFKINSDRHYLLIVAHHTIADGWSLGVFLQELSFFYQNIIEDKSAQLPVLPIQYADFAYWQTQAIRKESFEASLSYWKKSLGGELPILELPTDHPRSPHQNFSGKVFHFVISESLTKSIEKISQQENVTPFITLLSAFNILLHRYSGQGDILVGTPVASRNLPEIENLIGVFINTIVLRTNFSTGINFHELLMQVKEITLGAIAHQDLPFEKLVEELKPKRDLSRPPIFQVVFNLQNSPLADIQLPGLQIIPGEIDRGASQFELTLMISKRGQHYVATVEYNNALFKQQTIDRMFKSFLLLLEDGITHPDRRISDMQILSNEEQQHLVVELNQTQFDYPREKGIHQLFEDQVERTPASVALIHGQTTVTYLQLNNQANALARQLLQSGVSASSRVGIFMDKSPEMIVALLAVLKAGGTYVPIHTSFPEKRVRFILDDADVRLLITNVDVRYLGVIEIPVLNLIDDNLSIPNTTSNLQSNFDSNQLANIIYTSGSTGQPKGVMVPHVALVNFLCSMRSRPGINENDVLLTVTPISFDIAALELFLPLIVGAAVVIAGTEITTNPLLLGQAIKNYEVTIMQATPATWQMLLDSGWTGVPGLKALCGGDMLPRNLANKILDRVDSLWNMYGPTETTVWSAVCEVKKGNDPITIGQPIANTQLYILDLYQQPVPIGVVGELYIGGDGVSLGYLNQPQLTLEKFVPDIFNSIAGSRFYKTGDHARYLADGSIDVLGRFDDQVKINGHRIELGEISSVLKNHPFIHDAIVVSREELSGEKRLIAYFVSDEDKLTNVEIQEFVRNKLPLYMTPALFIRLKVLPLTTNGKIDRKALPIPEDVLPHKGYAAPRNEKEKILVDIWQDVLHIAQVGIHDNYFDLGGASIQSLQIVAHANLSGFQLSPESIFEYQTIAELATIIKSDS